jgi:hypothetical protein
MSDTRDIVVSSPSAYALSVQEVKNQVVKIQELMRDLMTEGEHYGPSFPGDTKKNLLKPGADKLNFMFRFRAEYEQEYFDLGGDHREVRSKCQIFHIESGVKISEGIGTCSTKESKYRWRNQAKKCPICGSESIIKGKEEYGGGYVCFAKKGGCGAKFKDDDESITKQPVGKIENPDIADVWNTVAKISGKRSYVAATIQACAASDIFSQDAEDFIDVTHGDAPSRSEPSKPAAQTKPANTAPINPDEYEARLDHAVKSGKLTEAAADTWRDRLAKPGSRKGAEDWIRANTEAVPSTMSAGKAAAVEAEIVDEKPAAPDIDAAADAGFNKDQGLF